MEMGDWKDSCPAWEHFHCRHCGKHVVFNGHKFVRAESFTDTTCTDSEGNVVPHQGTLREAGHEKI